MMIIIIIHFVEEKKNIFRNNGSASDKINNGTNNGTNNGRAFDESNSIYFGSI